MSDDLMNGWDINVPDDFTDAPPLVDKGVFPATLYDLKNDPSAAGYPMITAVFKLQGGPFDGWTRSVYFPLTQEDKERPGERKPMLWKINVFLKVFGVPALEAGKKITIPRTQMLGRPCRLQFDHEPDTYNDPTGKTLRDVIKNVLPPIAGQAATSPQIPATSAPAPSSAPTPAAPVAAEPTPQQKAAATRAANAAKKAEEEAAAAVPDPVAEAAVQPVDDSPAPDPAPIPAEDPVPAEDGADNEFDFS